MSFEEHLIENALIECEHILRGEKDFDKARNDFLDNETNKYMGEKSLTNLYTVWAMADYVIYTWCDGQDIQKLLDVMTHDEIKARITEGMGE